MSGVDLDPGVHTCPACGDEFLCEEGKEWRTYVNHLESHLEEAVGRHARLDYHGGRWETTHMHVTGVLVDVTDDGAYIIEHTTRDGETRRYRAAPPTDPDDDHCSAIVFTEDEDGEFERIGHVDSACHEGVILPDE